jgi:hypothetical protein
MDDLSLMKVRMLMAEARASSARRHCDSIARTANARKPQVHCPG